MNAVTLTITFKFQEGWRRKREKAKTKRPRQPNLSLLKTFPENPIYFSLARMVSRDLLAARKLGNTGFCFCFQLGILPPPAKAGRKKGKIVTGQTTGSLYHILFLEKYYFISRSCLQPNGYFLIIRSIKKNLYKIAPLLLSVPNGLSHKCWFEFLNAIILLKLVSFSSLGGIASNGKIKELKTLHMQNCSEWVLRWFF